ISDTPLANIYGSNLPALLQTLKPSIDPTNIVGLASIQCFLWGYIFFSPFFITWSRSPIRHCPLPLYRLASRG
ncbi:hypothetical protein BDZ97DRAFT_1832820, partial [Flammula alnicola]